MNSVWMIESADGYADPVEHLELYKDGKGTALVATVETTLAMRTDD
jgi:hypothetical protein